MSSRLLVGLVVLAGGTALIVLGSSQRVDSNTRLVASVMGMAVGAVVFADAYFNWTAIPGRWELAGALLFVASAGALFRESRLRTAGSSSS